MQDFVSQVSENALFEGIAPQEMEVLMGCLRPIKRNYHKNEVIWQEGDCVHTVGLVAQGKVLILRDDFWGTAVFWARLPRVVCLGSPMPVRRGSP